MKTIWLIAAAGAAVSVAACDGLPRPGGRPLKPLAKLECPQTQGGLTRVSASADGKTCVYTAADGAQVQLTYLQVQGTPEQSLAAVERQLRSALPSLEAPAQSPATPATVVSGAAKTAAVADAEKAAAAARADAVPPQPKPEDSGGWEQEGDGEDGHDNVNINLPGFKLKTEGENADINLFGMKVKVDDKTEQVRVERKPKSGVGRSFSVDANDAGAVVRMNSGNKVNVKSMLILAADDDNTSPAQDQFAAYVARGPRTGPLVLATIRSKDKSDTHDFEGDDLIRDVTKLVKRNAGG